MNSNNLKKGKKLKAIFTKNEQQQQNFYAIVHNFFPLIYHFLKLNLDFIYLKSKEHFVQPLFKMEPGLRRNFFIALSFTLYDRQMAVTHMSNYVEKSSSKVGKKAPQRERENF